MEPINFAYWLQGFAELNVAPPTPEQWAVIREHLDTVFNKETTKKVLLVEDQVGPFVTQDQRNDKTVGTEKLIPKPLPSVTQPVVSKEAENLFEHFRREAERMKLPKDPAYPTAPTTPIFPGYPHPLQPYFLKQSDDLGKLIC